MAIDIRKTGAAPASGSLLLPGGAICPNGRGADSAADRCGGDEPAGGFGLKERPSMHDFGFTALGCGALRFSASADAILAARSSKRETSPVPSGADDGEGRDSAQGPDGKYPDAVDRDSNGRSSGDDFDHPGFPSEGGGDFLGFKGGIAGGALLAVGPAGPQDFPGYEPKKGKSAPSRSGNGYGVENPGAPFEHPEIFKGPVDYIRPARA